MLERILFFVTMFVICFVGGFAGEIFAEKFYGGYM
jgi:hypothetical protein